MWSLSSLQLHCYVLLFSQQSLTSSMSLNFWKWELESQQSIERVIRCGWWILVRALLSLRRKYTSDAKSDMEFSPLSHCMPLFQLKINNRRQQSLMDKESLPSTQWKAMDGSEQEKCSKSHNRCNKATQTTLSIQKIVLETLLLKVSLPFLLKRKVLQLLRTRILDKRCI